MTDFFVSGNHWFIFYIFVGSYLWVLTVCKRKLTKEGMIEAKIAFILIIFIAPDIHEDASHKHTVELQWLKHR